MKNRTLKTIAAAQALIVVLFAVLTIGSVLLDLPHYLFGDTSTMYSQRFGEIIVELGIFGVAFCLQIALVLHLHGRIKILEGFLPICANCKRIRNDRDQWEQVEEYITKHSLAEFTHGICPECVRKLYPEYEDTMEETSHSTADRGNNSPLTSSAQALPHDDRQYF